MRTVRLHSDSPPLPNKFRNVAPYKDEGEKAHEARNRALFGSWQAHPADNFRFWSVQSPVWTYTLFFMFKVFGVGYASMRLLSVFCALLTLGVGSVMLLRSGFRIGSILFPVVLGLNFYFLIFTRLGLMEPMLIAWLALCAMFLVETRRDPRFFLLSTLCLTAGIFTKQSALLLLPIWAGFLVRLIAGTRKKPAINKNIGFAFLLAASVLILLAPLVAAFLSPDYRELWRMNVHHGFHFTAGVSLAPALERLARIVSSFSPGEMWRSYFMMLPFSSILGTGYVAYIGFRTVKRREVSGLEWLLLFWLLIGRASATATPHQVVRFHLLYFFPLSMMAVMAADRLWQGADLGSRGEKIMRGLVVLLVACELFMTGTPWLKWVTHPRYDIFSASTRLGEILESEERELGVRPVVIGEWVGPLSLQNRMACHYVKGGFNMKRRALASFGITHLLESTTRYDPAVGRFKKLFPEIYDKRELVAEFPVRTRSLALWRLPPPNR